MKVERGILNNNLRYLSVFDKNSNSVSVTLLLRVGSRFEDEKTSGLAHFIEHIFFKGTEKYPTSKSLGMAVENLGGSSNAFTSYEYTGYYIKAPKEKFAETIAIMAEIMKNPLFPINELEKEKGVIIEEIRMYDDIPMSKVGSIFMENLYKNHPLGRDIAGSIETVSAFSKDDVIKFLDEHYNAENMLIAIAGGISNEEIKDSIQNHFSDIKKGNVSLYKPHKQTQLNKEVYSKVQKVEQTHLVLGGFGVPRGYTNKIPLKLGLMILSGGFGSILFQVIREELGLAYYVRANHSEFHETGMWKITMGVDNKRVEEAIEKLIEELENFKKGKFSDEDLNRAKNYYMGSLITDLETSEELATWYGIQDLLEGKVKDIEKLKSEIFDTTREEIVKEWSQLITPNNMMLSILSPREFTAGLF